nr:RNA-directed DNA polymerase, eukaryota, reverse transcriptase zinc-binding domain protein [Tanacetum cinerariifolium]
MMQRKMLNSRLGEIDRMIYGGHGSKDIMSERRDLLQKVMDLDDFAIKDNAQKTNIKWIKEGDENTKLYHGMLKRKRRQNNISGVVIDGDWVEMLERTFSDQRFKMQYVRMDVTKLQEFYVSGHITSGCNSLFITLTPKYENPTLIKDFRPISLIDLQYKIISKLLADRLVKVVDSVVSPEQSAFIKGLQITDSVLMANVIVTWAKKHKKKIMMFKVDFEKAYDSLSWNYLDCMFDYMGFGDKWRMWIQGCLVSARSSVLLNGSSTKEFHIHRGLRQGDPLSTFMFILAMEGLHILIEDAVQNSQFRGVFMESPPIHMSHLFYADDAIFMGEWDRNNVGSLIRLLNIFYLASGLQLNLQKSKLYRIGVTNVNVQELARCICCEADSLPSVYLGLHVGERMYRINSLRHLLESIRVRFFWGIDDNEKKIQWVKWDVTLNSKEKGRLDVGGFLNEGTAKSIVWASIVKALMELHKRDFIPYSAIRRKAIRINSDQDVCQWKFTDEESFKVRYVRNSLDVIRLSFSSTATRWCKILPIKVNVFVWRAMLKRLPTRLNLDRRGIDTNSLLCPCCNSIVENSNHVFYSCNVALKLWKKIIV